MPLDPALSRVPGLGGYLAMRQYADQQQAGQMQQVQQFQTMQGAAQQQEERVRVAQRDQAMRAELAALGPEPRQEDVVKVVTKYAPAEAVLRSQQSSLDRQATIAASTSAREDALAQRAMQNDQLHEQRMQRLQNDADKAAELARYNRDRLDLQQQLVDLRRGQGQRPAAAPKAPVGFRFSADGETLEPIPGGPKDKPKPQLPTQALKLQQAELDSIGIGASINADLGGVLEQIDSGKLKLGLLRNLESEGRQFIGRNDTASAEYGTFKATLEKLRNDSLRLNKGVQTDGDAQRAWNEVLTRITDAEFVKKRLGEIQKINERAVNLRKMNVDAIRSNYGVEPMDVSGYEQVPGALGGTPAPKADNAVKVAVEKAGYAFEPDKYEYRVGIGGQVQRKPKK